MDLMKHKFLLSSFVGVRHTHSHWVNVLLLLVIFLLRRLIKSPWRKCALIMCPSWRKIRHICIIRKIFCPLFRRTTKWILYIRHLKMKQQITQRLWLLPHLNNWKIISITLSFFAPAKGGNSGKIGGSNKRILPIHKSFSPYLLGLN